MANLWFMAAVCLQRYGGSLTALTSFLRTSAIPTER
jgi:hypothetical protein